MDARRREAEQEGMAGYRRRMEEDARGRADCQRMDATTDRDTQVIYRCEDCGRLWSEKAVKPYEGTYQHDADLPGPTRVCTGKIERLTVEKVDVGPSVG